MVHKLLLAKHVYDMLNPTKRILLEESQQIEQATLGQHTSAVWKENHTKKTSLATVVSVVPNFGPSSRLIAAFQ